MKKIIFVILVIVLVFCFLGCATQNHDTQNNLSKMDEREIYVWIDEKTGVQYIVYSEKSGYAGTGGITPRLNADGTLYIESEEKK